MIILRVAFAILLASNLAPSSAEVQQPFRRMQVLDDYEPVPYPGPGPSKSKGEIAKPYPAPTIKPTPTPPHPSPPVEPINKLCFTRLAAIWWSWYLCYFDKFQTVDNTCPVQDKRVPANTTFLFYDNQQQNCTGFKTNERLCTIPADHWIILPAANYAYATDFVSPGNTLDTPEGDKNTSNTVIDAFSVTAKIDGNVTYLPRYESQDLCNLETVDVEGCTDAGSYTVTNGWTIFSDGYWLRIPPLVNGTHTIEVTNTAYGSCSGTTYIITSV